MIGSRYCTAVANSWPCMMKSPSPANTTTVRQQRCAPTPAGRLAAHAAAGGRELRRTGGTARKRCTQAAKLPRRCRCWLRQRRASAASPRPSAGRPGCGWAPGRSRSGRRRRLPARPLALGAGCLRGLRGQRGAEGRGRGVEGSCAWYTRPSSSVRGCMHQRDLWRGDGQQGVALRGHAAGQAPAHEQQRSGRADVRQQRRVHGPGRLRSRCWWSNSIWRLNEQATAGRGRRRKRPGSRATASACPSGCRRGWLTGCAPAQQLQGALDLRWGWRSLYRLVRNGFGTSACSVSMF